MSSKITIALVLGMLVMFFLMSSEVAAKDLNEDEVVGEANRVDGANLVAGGGGYGIGGGFPGGGFPGGGFPGGGFPRGGFPGGGGFPRGGFPPRFCRFGCCLRNQYTRQCFGCCP